MFFRINGDIVEMVDTYKYLGFHLHEFMDYNVHANKTAEAGSRALGAMLSKFHSLKNVTYTTFTNLYHSCVTSVLDHASEIWGNCKTNSCDQVQQRALRYFLGVHRFCPLPVINGDMGWNTCSVRRKLNMLRMWNRFIKMSNDNLAKKVFLWDYSLLNSTWCSDIENILDDVGYIDILYRFI